MNQSNCPMLFVSDLSDIDEFEPSASEQLVDAALEVYACPALAGVEASPQAQNEVVMYVHDDFNAGVGCVGLSLGPHRRNA